MNSYEFSMEKVLRWRQDTEKTNMENLGHIQNELRHQEAILRDLIIEGKNIKSNGLIDKDVNQLRFRDLYKQKIYEEIREQDQIIHKTNEKLEDARLELIEAQKNRKIMEKLKEKDKKAYIKNINHIQQNELDEIAVLKHEKQDVI